MRFNRFTQILNKYLCVPTSLKKKTQKKLEQRQQLWCVVLAAGLNNIIYTVTYRGINPLHHATRFRALL